jgi:hypothetical protein
MNLKALAFNCTLKASPGSSSTEKLLRQLISALDRFGVESELFALSITISNRAFDRMKAPGMISRPCARD